MTMRNRIARLFTIKTRTEALLVTYAIAVGAIERGLHYMDQYPGYGGILLALACLGVPFIAGAKLIDAVKPVPAAAPAVAGLPRRHPRPSFNRTRATAERPFRRSPYRAARRID